VTISTSGKVIAFYSYKGGTGRTMALANVGCALARDPKLQRPVLLVDWDLEAPGLHRYFRKQVATQFGGDEFQFDKAQGLIDLFLELQSRTASDGDSAREDYESVAPLFNEVQLEKYIIKTDVPRLHLIKAGSFSNAYAANIASFQWPELYRRSPYLLRAFADRLASDYSFVVIDSRTGLTDTSGICAMLMPEVLVAVFTPNRQSLFGVLDLVREAASYRARSDDLRPLMVYPLPSRIEASEPALRHSWRFGDRSASIPGFQGMFEEAFKEIYELPACDLGPYFDDVQIQHLPDYAYGEEIAVLVEQTHDRLSLTHSYLRFTTRLAKGEVPWAAPTPLEETSQEQSVFERRLPLESGWRWFLSFNSRDQALAEAFKVTLERAQPTSSLYFTPSQLRAGGSWSASLGQGIAEANGFILLIGAHNLSPWQVIEFGEALERRAKSPDFPIVLVLLEGQTAPGLPFLLQCPWVITSDPASEKTVARLIDSAAGGGAFQGNRWRYTAPYRGLAAMTEADADFFFGRARETVEVIEVLAAMPDKMPLLIGSSGVGKTSLAEAGVLAALLRQSWPQTATFMPWPNALNDSRRWCVLKFRPGTDPVRGLVDSFFRIWRFDATDPGRLSRVAEWTEGLLQQKVTLSDLIDATERRLEDLRDEHPRGYLIYIDQGEELYVRAEEHQRRCFAELVAKALGYRRVRAMMSLRSDFLGELQRDEWFFAVHRLINVPPMGRAELLEVVSRPAELLGARFETKELSHSIADRAARESVRDAGSLPLLSYLLDDMWQEMVVRGDGVLRLSAHSLELGDVFVKRADEFLAHHPDSADILRRIFTLYLTHIREDGEPIRRLARRSEFSDEEWRLITQLSDYPNRLVVTGSSDEGEVYAVLPHEAVLRRWPKLREWITNEREFLAWRSGVEAARLDWQAAPDASKKEALLMGLALARAHSWLDKRGQDLTTPDYDFILASIARERRAKWRVNGMRALAYSLLVGTIVGLVAWINQDYIHQQWRWYTFGRPFVANVIQPYVLTIEAEQALKPGETFRECNSMVYCPEMVVVPAGSFLMGSSQSEAQDFPEESPQHEVKIARLFAVSKFQLTFDLWDTCVTYGDCSAASDAGWGRGPRPVILVSWHDAQQYTRWLSKLTGKTYRLLSEAEYEYATRAGTQTHYPWGDDIGKNNANCDGCGSEWGGVRTAPVGSFAPNAFGLYDMVGNLWEWVEDCYYPTYDGAPTDGSASISGGCDQRVARGGSWSSFPPSLRSASRHRIIPAYRSSNVGFRIARTL
jgi:formylglycine-generating enzyme required for sulfatase activity/cellulose biosynthesis protein BcsQ